jgi:phosphoenolpyruvate carboxylase
LTYTPVIPIHKATLNTLSRRMYFWQGTLPAMPSPTMPSDTSSSTLMEHGFRLLEAELAFLMEAFTSVLRRLGAEDLAEQLPWSGKELAVVTEPNRSLGQAYSTVFQLLNIVEERVASQVRRLREKERGPTAEKGLWAERLAALTKLGLNEAQLLEVLSAVRMEPVLTAHPTEAKRETVQERHREIYDLMNKHENPSYTPREQTRLKAQLENQLEALWRTGEIHVNRPSIEQELQNALHYLREVFPEAVTRTETHLREAWVAAGFDPAALDTLPPMLRFGNWIGGDRDGHPFVTSEVTETALKALRNNALRVHRRALESMGHNLPLSKHFQKVPDILQVLVDRLTSELAKEPSVNIGLIQRRNAEEPWRMAAFLMRAKVLVAVDKPDSTAGYKAPAEMDADLGVLADSLLELGAAPLVLEFITPIRRRLATFGFHGAHLDVRQNSAFHEKALESLLKQAGLLGDKPLSQWTQAEKRVLLDRELLSPRPFLAPGISAGPEADAVLDCYRVISRNIAQHGTAGLGALIVSMTRNTEDLLVVYILAREAGLMVWTDEGLHCPLPVTPLFETMTDLENGPGITEDFLQHPVTQRSLAAANEEGGPSFQMMIGYSDSNKDCGILASQWALHRGQEELSAASMKHGARPVFFHGRGGTVGRGAGPTHWFMEALPHGSLHGHLRMTEQGETIQQKYAHLGSAVYHTELLLASTADATARHLHLPSKPDPATAIMDRLALWSMEAYRELILAPDFITFYRGATPIDALENSRIGSRPSRRSGRPSLEDLRAIPWVFSWTQARFYLPGWFGAGAALERLRAEDPAGFQTLLEGSSTSQFLRYVLTNIESSLVSANEDFMIAYGNLVPDPELKERFMSVILAEYRRTKAVLTEIFRGSFESRRPRLAYTLAIREAPLRVLHQQQIALLKLWRGKQAEGDTAGAEAMLPDVLLSINAIASGLRTTG